MLRVFALFDGAELQVVDDLDPVAPDLSVRAFGIDRRLEAPEARALLAMLAPRGPDFGAFQALGSILSVFGRSPDEKWLVTSAIDGRTLSLSVSDAATGEAAATIDLERDGAYCADFSREDARVDVMTTDDIKAFDLSARSGPSIDETAGKRLRLAAVSPNCRYGVTSTFDRSGRAFVIHDLRLRQEIGRLASLASRSRPVPMAISPDGDILAYATTEVDGVEIARVSNAARLAMVENTHEVTEIVFDSTGDRVAFQGADGAIRIIHAETGVQILGIGPGNGALLGFGPNDDQIVVRGIRGEVRLIDISRDAILEKLCNRRSGRNLSRQAWMQHVGDAEPWEATCVTWPEARAD